MPASQQGGKRHSAAAAQAISAGSGSKMGCAAYRGASVGIVPAVAHVPHVLVGVPFNGIVVLQQAGRRHASAAESPAAAWAGRQAGKRIRCSRSLLLNA